MPTSKSNSRVIGITLGDPGGIGPEIVAKALSSRSLRSRAKFVIFGDEGLCALPKNANIEFNRVGAITPREVSVGGITQKNGRAALQYLRTAMRFIKSNRVDALVTAPVCKEAIILSEKSFIGHTEFLADACRVKSVGMMFVSDVLRTIIVTRHIPLNAVARAISSAAVLETIRLTHKALRTHFGISRPRIAVCGLNPHAGENGTIGREEQTCILPALRQAKRSRIQVFGPFAADTLFLPAKLKDYDCVVAMYHDQGLIPVKTLAFDKVVNLTVGLPFVRTSPAHGTAFDIAGQNKADPASMISALKLACDLV